MLRASSIIGAKCARCEENMCRGGANLPSESDTSTGTVKRLWQDAQEMVEDPRWLVWLKPDAKNRAFTPELLWTWYCNIHCTCSNAT